MNFVDEVAATPGGEKIRDCIQCGICAGSCPAACKMEYPPRRIIAMIRAGKRDEVLSSDSMWYCMSCYLCSERCPRDIKPTELAYALESLAVKNGYRVRGTHTPAVHHSYVHSLRCHGRIYEMGMMLRYYLTSNPFKAITMLPLAVKLLRRGRLPLLPPRTDGLASYKKVIARFRETGGE